ncbi:hypothetical protein C8R45DRAFT_1077604 [Mycena sanguinolenta]|nr:hypothetical protein C8R45DRAFT_1077604 [Mycena sanguinolenta]
MPSTRVCQGGERNASRTAVETPVHPPMSSQSDAAAILDEQSDRALDTERESNECQIVNNYISGGQGGNGGGGGLQGGAGGIGEGPTLQYDIKAENIVMKTFTCPELTPSDFLRIPLGNIDLRSEIQVNATRGVVWRGRERKCVRRMYSARVVGLTSDF